MIGEKETAICGCSVCVNYREGLQRFENSAYHIWQLVKLDVIERCAMIAESCFNGVEEIMPEMERVRTRIADQIRDLKNEVMEKSAE